MAATPAPGTVDVQKVRLQWAYRILGVHDGKSVSSSKDIEEVRKKTKDLYKQNMKDKKEREAKKVLEAFEIIKNSRGAKPDKQAEASGSGHKRKVPSAGSKEELKAKRPNGHATPATRPADAAAKALPGQSTGRGEAKSQPKPKDHDRFRRIAGAAQAPALAGSAKQLLSRSKSALVCSRCGQTSFLVEAPTGSFMCPICRVRAMDPFNLVMEGKKGLLKLVMMEKYLTKDSFQEAKFRLKFNLPQLQQWRKVGQNVEIRMCTLETCEPRQSWPNTLTCQVNGRKAFDISAPASGHKRRDVPRRISADLRTGSNTLEVKMQDLFIKRFALALVRTAPQLPKQLLKQVKVLSEDQSKRRLTELLFASKLESTGEEVNAEDGADRCRLVCPITLSRIETPARGKRCRHLQCFDLKAYFVSNFRMAAFNRRWRCPVCDTVLKPPGDLFVDVYMLHVLAKSEDDDEEVAFDNDGAWRVTAKAAEPLPPSSDEEEARVPESKVDDCSVQELSVIDPPGAADVDVDADADVRVDVDDLDADDADAEADDPEVEAEAEAEAEADAPSATAPSGSPASANSVDEVSLVETVDFGGSPDVGECGASPEVATIDMDGSGASPDACAGASPEALERGSSRMACLGDDDDVLEDDDEDFYMGQEPEPDADDSEEVATDQYDDLDDDELADQLAAAAKAAEAAEAAQQALQASP